MIMGSGMIKSSPDAIFLAAAHHVQKANGTTWDTANGVATLPSSITSPKIGFLLDTPQPFKTDFAIIGGARYVPA